MNGFFKNSSRWTWIGPNHEYKIQITFILTPMDNQSIINFDVSNKFKYVNDHRFLYIILQPIRTQYYKKKEN